MLQLFGVASLDGGDEHMLAVPSELVIFRDLGALVADSPVARPKITEAGIKQYREVVETVFLQRAVLPAPMGVVFRSREMLLRWMELHYVTLVEGLAFVEGRVGARIYVSLRNLSEVPSGQTVEAAADLDAIASVSFRIFRRQAAGWATIRGPRETALTSGASFLVDRDKWEQFAEAVEAEEQRTPELRYRLTGPWPPYDFVRMQFGG